MKKLSIFLLLPCICQCMLISSPFDNFRIECPQNSGTQRLSIKMVESQGMKRQDTVFALSCNKIDEIYPWSDIPQGVLELEREDCYYTNMFDPIMDTNVSYTCAPREYLAGITRVTDTRIQTMCCRLRTRDEANCENIRFGKPLGYDGKVEIQLKGKLINALTVEKNLYKIRFCDLVPRAIGSILSDVKTTTIRPVTTPKLLTTTEHTTSVPLTTTITSNKLTEEQIKEKTVTEVVESIQNAPSTSQSNNIVAEENLDSMNAEEELNAASNDEIQQQPELLETSTELTAMNNETITEDASQISSSKEEASAEEKILSPLPETPNNSSSLEVRASPMPHENIFPTDKDYENIEEAEAELMTTIAEMIKARNIAKNIISKVKAAGVKQLVKEKQEKMAEELLREIEGQTDPVKADELFKQSIEMLNELSEAKQIMSTEEFSKEMMRQEDKKNEEIALVDSLESDAFDPIKQSSEKLTTFSLPHIFTNSPFVAPSLKLSNNTNNVQLKTHHIHAKISDEDPSQPMPVKKESFETIDTEMDYPIESSSAAQEITTSTTPTSSNTNAFSFTKSLHPHILSFRTTTDAAFTDISQSLEDVFDYSKPKSLFFKKHTKKPFLKPL